MHMRAHIHLCSHLGTMSNSESVTVSEQWLYFEEVQRLFGPNPDVVAAVLAQVTQRRTCVETGRVQFLITTAAAVHATRDRR